MSDFFSKFNDNWLVEGFFRMAANDPQTGRHKVLVDRKNVILDQAPLIMARAASGVPNSAISHLYLGFSNNAALPSGWTVASSDYQYFPYTAGPTSNYNAVRVPLTFNPSIETVDSEPASRLLVYNFLISQPSSLVFSSAGGIAALTSGTSGFFEAALVCATVPAETPASHAGDLMFSRITFDQVTYSSSFNITVTWGIKFTPPV